MHYEIYPCSAVMQSRIKNWHRPDEPGINRAEYVKLKFPLDSLLVGSSIAVPFDQVEREESLRLYVSRTGKKLGKKFSVIRYSDLQLYEIGRV